MNWVLRWEYTCYSASQTECRFNVLQGTFMVSGSFNAKAHFSSGMQWTKESGYKRNPGQTSVSNNGDGNNKILYNIVNRYNNTVI